MNPCVLIVEDDATISSLLAKGFKEAGCEIMEVTSGEAALDVVQTKGVQLITLDLGLSGQKSGMDVLEELRKAGSKIRVVVIAGDITLKLCRRVWPDDEYTTWHGKPVTMDGIYAMVKGATT